MTMISEHLFIAHWSEKSGKKGSNLINWELLKKVVDVLCHHFSYFLGNPVKELPQLDRTFSGRTKVQATFKIQAEGMNERKEEMPHFVQGAIYLRCYVELKLTKGGCKEIFRFLAIFTSEFSHSKLNLVFLKFCRSFLPPEWTGISSYICSPPLIKFSKGYRTENALPESSRLNQSVVSPWILWLSIMIG